MYVVYRGVSAITSPIADTNYVDEDVIIGSGQTITYKVRAVLAEGSVPSTGFSNTASTQGNFWKQREDGSPSEDSFALLAVWPNPFNSSTTITYVLPAVADVKLAVYDLLGREVAVLENERKDGGTHEVKCDASDLPSGMYLYRLTAGNCIQTRKLILAK